MERIIKVSVRDKIASAPLSAQYVCGNSDFVIAFDFDDEWASYEAKTARFRYNGLYQDVPFNGNECPIPILSNIYSFEVGVYAGELHTTTPAYVPARKSILCGGGTPDSGGGGEVTGEKVDVDQGVENAGMLLYVGSDGKVTVLALGDGLQIIDGALSVTGTPDEPDEPEVIIALCGQALCGTITCGGAA